MPATARPTTAQMKCPDAMSSAVTTEQTRPKIVSASAVTPSRRNRSPTGPRPCSTPLRQRRSSMRAPSWTLRALRARVREQSVHRTKRGTRSFAIRPGSLLVEPGEAFVESPARRARPWGSSVKTFPTAKIRNVALVGHGGAGKTSLAEALLFNAGAIVRLGRVEDGSTVCDFDPEEQRRNISVSLAMAPFELDDHKVNVLDAPGYADFVGDVAAAIQAADLALFVVSAVEGVEVQTEIAWKLAEQRGLPRAIFVNKLDRERASFSRTLDELKTKFGAGVAPLQLPIGEEADLHGVIELLNDVAVTYSGGAPKGTEGGVPGDMETEEHEVHDALVEGIVVGDDDLMERYLGDEKIETEELARALAAGVASGSVFPVLCGSATKLIGVDRLAKFLVDEAPAPALDGGQPGALVFKTIVDPYV